MEKDILEKFKQSWKNGIDKILTDQSISEIEIKNYLNMRSKNITRLYKKGIWTDIGLKGLIFASFSVLVILYLGNFKIILFNTVLIASCLLLIFFQRKILKSVKKMEQAIVNLKQSLSDNITFFNKKYIRSVFIAALSSPLIFISGMMYYFYYKYGYIRPLDATDFVVLGIAVILAFIISFLSQLYQFKFHINQLEECLNDLTEEKITAQTLKRQKAKRLLLLSATVLALTFGLLLLLYFLL